MGLLVAEPRGKVYWIYKNHSWQQLEAFIFVLATILLSSVSENIIDNQIKEH